MLADFSLFFSGAVFGITSLILGSLILGGRLIKKDKAAQQAIIDDLNKQKALLKVAAELAAKAVSTVPPADTVKERLHKAVQITLRQNKLDTRVSDDDLILHNELELEKLIILRSILADGFDPSITVRFNSGDQEQSLSAYVANIQKGLN